MKLKKSIDALKLFEDAARKHSIATEQGDYIVANKNYKKIVESITYLKSENALDSLLLFLNNESVGVRIWAATYVLKTDEKAGVKILKEIIKQGGILSLNAEMTLNEWEKGNLKL